MKENEPWVKKMREKLEDYSEPLPASGWQQLEKELLSPAKNRSYSLRQWAVGAAAAVLVAVSSVSLYFLNTSTADDIRHTAIPTLAVIPSAVPQPQSIDAQTAKVKPSSVALLSRSNHSMNQDKLLSLPTEVEVVPVDKKEATPLAIEKEEAAAVAHGTNKAKEAHKPSGRDKLHLPAKRKKSAKSNWALSASVSSNSFKMAGLDTNTSEAAFNSPQFNLTLSPDGMMYQSPLDQNLLFKDGIPYLEQYGEVSFDHHQPISVGISLRKDLAKGFSIESGVMYTFLSSDVKQAGSNSTQEQQLHYIGIPLRANWNFVDQERFTLYVSAGAAVEKCVYGQVAGQKERVNPLQLSATAAVGAQYNASKRVGIYVEPGVAYFFDDGSTVQTIRKESPFTINLQAGIRLTY